MTRLRHLKSTVFGLLALKNFSKKLFMIFSRTDTSLTTKMILENYCSSSRSRSRSDPGGNLFSIQLNERQLGTHQFYEEV